MTRPVIGVLALQGGVDLHDPHIAAAGGIFLPVKFVQDFSKIDGLILPGGESTTMIHLLRRFDMWDTLKDFTQTKPTWGICAGAILLAKNVTNPAQDSLGVLDCTIERNGYGRQLQSCDVDIDGTPVSFIRAPVITGVGTATIIRATRDDQPVWIEQDHIMATTFHPEMNLTTPSKMHRGFVGIMTGN